MYKGLANKLNSFANFRLIFNENFQYAIFYIIFTYQMQIN